VSKVVVPWLRRLVIGFPPEWHRFEDGSGHVGFVTDKLALEQVFCRYFGSSLPVCIPQQSSSSSSSCGAGAIGQTVASVPSGLSHSIKRKKRKLFQELNSLYKVTSPKKIVTSVEQGA
jgi:hypothetical protein